MMQRPLRVQDVSPTAAAWSPYSWSGILSLWRDMGYRNRIQMLRPVKRGKIFRWVGNGRQMILKSWVPHPCEVCKGAGSLIQERDRFPPREFSRVVRIGSPVPILTLNWQSTDLHGICA